MTRTDGIAGLVAAALLAVPAGADDSDPGKPGKIRTALRGLGRDGAWLVTAPARPTRRGLIVSGAVTAGVFGLVLVDDEIRREVQERRSPSLDRWERRIEPFGHARNTALGALAVWGAGKVSRHEATTETGRALLESLLFAEAIGLGAKGAFGRAPPGDGNRAGDFFHGGSFFPSGHTWNAFAFATVLAERHGRAAAWTAYPLATLVGLSRIERDVHWASDVFAGAVLGHVVARAVVRRREGRLDTRRQTRWQPWIDREPQEVVVGVRFAP